VLPKLAVTTRLAARKSACDYVRCAACMRRNFTQHHWWIHWSGPVTTCKGAQDRTKPPTEVWEDRLMRRMIHRITKPYACSREVLRGSTAARSAQRRRKDAMKQDQLLSPS
jgi:hypothetical protein